MSPEKWGQWKAHRLLALVELEGVELKRQEDGSIRQEIQRH